MPVPFPALWEMAQQQAAAQLGALIGSTRRSSRRETAAGRRFIRSLAHSFADELGAISGGIGETYNMAERESAATNAALANYLQGSGNQLGDQLASQLSYAGPDALNAFAGGARRQGQALGRTAAAFGTQQTNRIVGEEASERTFGQSLPGIAALLGIQSARQYEGQQARSLATQVDQLHSQQPGLAAELYNAFASQRLQQMEMAQNARFHRDEMAQSQAAQMGEVDRYGQERLDRVSQGALEFMQHFIPPPNPVTGEAGRPNAGEAMTALRSYWRKFYPSQSNDWINMMARQTVESYGVNDPARLQGLLGAVQPRSGGVTGALMGTSRLPEGLEGGGGPRGARPTTDSIWYSSPAELMSQARSKLGASPNSLRWEGPGYYRKSGDQIIKVG